MWRSYTITAVRNLLRNRFYSVLNLVGLAVGISAVLLIALYVHYELTWDRQIPDADRIFRVMMKPEDVAEEGVEAHPWISIEVGRQYFVKVPGIVSITNVCKRSQQIRHGEELIRQYVHYVEPSFFDVFQPTVLEGDPKNFLINPEGVLLTRGAAEKFFGETLVTGRTLLIDNGAELQEVQVEGVLEDPRPNESLTYEILMPFKLRADYYSRDNPVLWNTIFSNTWLRLEHGIDPDNILATLHALPIVDGDPEQKSRDPKQYMLQPLTDVHIDLANPENFRTDGNPQAIVILSAIALAVLLLACVNYAILTVGRSTFRQREIGVRKVLGAQRAELGRQFWLETALLVLCSLLPALLLVELILPMFNEYTNAALSLHANLPTTILCVVVIVATTFLAGLYPAMVMTRYPILNALKGSQRIGGRGRFRRALLMLQLSVTILLGSVTTVMVLQLKYVLNRDLGYQPQNLVSLRATAREGMAAEFAAQLESGSLSTDGIADIAAASCTFGKEWNRVRWGREDGGEFLHYQNTVTPGFLQTCSIAIVQGRDFRPDEQSGSVIVNEAFVRELELDDPIGATIPWLFKEARIIGVTQDFHYHSLHEPIEPLVLTLGYGDMQDGARSLAISQYGVIPGFVLVRLAPHDQQVTIDAMRGLWRQWGPEAGFDVSFVDDVLATQYREEQRWNRIVAITTGLAILIALLGIAGVTVLQVLQRSKEIGIRKTLGASVASILTLLSRETVGLILFATAIAGPAAWVVSQRWLSTFAFRVDAGFMPMVVAASVVLLLAVGLVLALSYRLSQVRPADVLRDE